MDLCQIVTTNTDSVNTDQALITCVKDEMIAIPIPSIISVENIAVSDISLVDSDDVIYLRGHVIPLLYLDKLFGCAGADEKKDNITVVICAHDNSYVGLVVDQLIGQEDIESKSLGILDNNRIFSGASIVSNDLAMILDVPALIA